MPSANRTSCVELIFSRPYRVPSAPWRSTRSSGLTPVPSDFDIRRPSAAWITEWMTTSVNGTSPMNSMPSISIRATHRLMISRAVEFTLPG